MVTMLCSSSAQDTVAFFRFSYIRIKEICITKLIIIFLQILNEVNFFNSGLSSVMRWEDGLVQIMSLTIKSDVLFYTINENGFKLTECYTIKAGAPIYRKVGAWDRIDGLVIPEPNIWQRRSNLGQVSMEICVAPVGTNIFLIRVHNSTQKQAFCKLYIIITRRLQLLDLM